MKKAVLVSATLLLCSVSRAQERSPAPTSGGNGSAVSTQEIRMRTLEEQVRSLAEEVAVLRGELKAVRDAKSAEPASDPRILLTAAHIEPGMLPANPPPTAASASPGLAPASSQ